MMQYSTDTVKQVNSKHLCHAHICVYRISFQTNLKNFSAQHFLIVFVFWIRWLWSIWYPSASLKSATHYEINNNFLTSHIWVQHIKTIPHFLTKALWYYYYVDTNMANFAVIYIFEFFEKLRAECLCFAKNSLYMDLYPFYVWMC